MVVKPNHPFVDRNGSVHSPYLRSWVYPSSNLVDLVTSLSHLFGQDPPLYSRQNPNPSLLPYQARPVQQRRRPTEDPAEVYRRNAINKVLEQVRGDMAAMRKGREAEMEGMFGTQAALWRRAEEIAIGVREMTEEKEALEQQVQLVMKNSDLLEGWVRENVGKRRRDLDADADELFELTDALSGQMVECTAADLAVDDTVYSLDKAVQEGAIRFELYLKTVRGLSREQFFHQALAAKVRAARVQMQVAGMAARAHWQYAT